MNTEATPPTGDATHQAAGVPGGAVQLIVPATYAGVRMLDAVVVDLLTRAGGVDADTCSEVELAVHEVATNIVDHAYAGVPADQPGRIGVTVALTGGAPGAGSRAKSDVGGGGLRRLVVELEDTGAPFDPTAVAPLNLEIPQEGGYGLFLAESLLDEVQYTRRASTNVWRLVKTLSK